MEALRIKFLKLMLAIFSVLLIKEMFFIPRTITIVNPIVAEASQEALGEVIEVKAVTDTTDDILKRVGSKYELDWKILKGMYLKETQGDCSRIGDKQMPKPSVGCFQISMYFHNDVSYENAMDLEWSADWTAKRLKRYSDKGGIDYAVMAHNGTPNTAKTLNYLNDVKENMKNL